MSIKATKGDLGRHKKQPSPGVRNHSIDRPGMSLKATMTLGVIAKHPRPQYTHVTISPGDRKQVSRKTPLRKTKQMVGTEVEEVYSFPLFFLQTHSLDGLATRGP